MLRPAPSICILAVVIASVRVTSLGSPQAIRSSDECAITYVANAGVLFETGGRKFLIDAPIRGGIPPYAAPSPAEGEALENARAPFNGVSAILVTHWHEDHFDADAIAQHLRNSADTVLVSSAEIVERVRKAGVANDAARLVAITPAPGSTQRTSISGVPVHVLRIRHNPARRLPEQHVGFLIEACQTVLHVGDADPAADNFALLKGLPRVQVGLPPFWYVSSEKSRAFVASSIRPGRVLGMHLPPEDVAEASRNLAGVADVMLLIRPMMRVSLRPPG